MKKLFSQREFIPDMANTRILQVISDEPGRTVNDIVTRLLPEHDTWAIRSGIHQLVLKKYLREGSSGNEIRLEITETGHRLLQKSMPE